MFCPAFRKRVEMKKQETIDPTEIALFGADGVVWYTAGSNKLAVESGETSFQPLSWRFLAWLGLLIVVDNSGVRVTKLLATFKPAIPVKFTRPGEPKEVAKKKALSIDLLSVSLGRHQSITSPRTQPNLNPYWCLLNQSSLWVSIYKGLYMLSVPWQRFVRHSEFFQHLRIASQKNHQ